MQFSARVFTRAYINIHWKGYHFSIPSVPLKPTFSHLTLARFCFFFISSSSSLSLFLSLQQKIYFLLYHFTVRTALVRLSWEKFYLVILWHFPHSCVFVAPFNSVWMKCLPFPFPPLQQLPLLHGENPGMPCIGENIYNITIILLLLLLLLLQLHSNQHLYTDNEYNLNTCVMSFLLIKQFAPATRN